MLIEESSDIDELTFEEVCVNIAISSSNGDSDSICHTATADQELELSFAYRDYLSKIPSSVLFHPFADRVIKVDLTETCFTGLTCLTHFKNLKILVLDKIGLTSLEDLPIILSLDTFWCNNNNFQDLSGLIEDIKQHFPNVTHLSMMRNPCCPGLYDLAEPDLDAYRLNRLYTLFSLPRLTVLDATPVSNEEGREAQRRGQYAVIRRRTAAVSHGLLLIFYFLN